MAIPKSGLRIIIGAVSCLAAVAASSSTVRNRVNIAVTFEGKPIAGLRLHYRDDTTDVKVTTNRGGIAVFTVNDEFEQFNLEVDCDGSALCDYVLRSVQVTNDGFAAAAVHSQQWQLRNTPRPCDQLALVEDIPRGSLASMSADEYNDWYAHLGSETASHCEVLHRLQRQVGSLAPWYFYEFKGLPQNCNNNKLVAELDWTRWYRDLLEKATGAHPGECVSAWEAWWSSKGYGAVPMPPDRKRLEMDF